MTANAAGGDSNQSQPSQDASANQSAPVRDAEEVKKEGDNPSTGSGQDPESKAENK